MAEVPDIMVEGALVGGSVQTGNHLKESLAMPQRPNGGPKKPSIGLWKEMA